MASRALANKPRARRSRRDPGQRGDLRASAHPWEKYGFEPKAFYTPSEVAEILQVSSQTILDWIHGGRLYGVQLSPRIYRIPLGGLLIHLGERPRVTRVIGRYRRGDDLQDERALARETERSTA